MRSIRPCFSKVFLYRNAATCGALYVCSVPEGFNEFDIRGVRGVLMMIVDNGCVDDEASEKFVPMAYNEPFAANSGSGI